MWPGEQRLILDQSKENVVELTILSLLCGISLPLFIRAIVELKRRGLGRRSSRVVLGVCVINMILLVLTFGVTFASTLLSLGRFSMAMKYGPLTIIEQVTMQLLPLIGDAIVIWRAVALYNEKRWMLIVPCVFFLLATGLSIRNFVNLGRLPSDQETSLSSVPNPDSLLFFLPCSTATNVGATFCIWFKLWSYRNQMRSFGLQKKHSSADQVLVLLVGSGVIYCALQVGNVFITYFGPFGIGSYIAFPVYLVFTAIYPAMVVVFVSEKRSVVEEFITSISQSPVESHPSSHGRPATFGHLSFLSSSPQESSGMFHGAQETASSNQTLSSSYL